MDTWHAFMASNGPFKNRRTTESSTFFPSRLHAQIVGNHLFMSPAGAILLIHSLSMCGLCLVHIVVSALRPLLGGMHTHPGGCNLRQQKNMWNLSRHSVWAESKSKSVQYLAAHQTQKLIQVCHSESAIAEDRNLSNLKGSSTWLTAKWRKRRLLCSKPDLSQAEQLQNSGHFNGIFQWNAWHIMAPWIPNWGGSIHFAWLQNHQTVTITSCHKVSELSVWKVIMWITKLWPSCCLRWAMSSHDIQVANTRRCQLQGWTSRSCPLDLDHCNHGW